MRWVALVWLVMACRDDETYACREPARMTLHGIADAYGFVPFTELPPMVAGGTIAIRPYCDTPIDNCGNRCPFTYFDLPYDVEVRDGPVQYAGLDLEGLPTFHAAEPGMGRLAFVDPRDGSIYADVTARAVELDQIVLERVQTEREPDDLEIVLATEHDGPAFRVNLMGAGNEQLIDSSLAMQLPAGAERTSVETFTLASVPPGSYVLGFEAGGKTLREPVVIVNEADTLEVWSAPATIPRTLVPGQIEYVCFLAKNAGRYISGLRWEHTVDGEAIGAPYSHGCARAITNQPSGSPVTFTAVAGGMSITIQIPAR